MREGEETMHKWPNDCKPPALPLTSSNMTARKRLMMKKPQMIITSTKYTHDHDENVSVRAYLQCTHTMRTHNAWLSQDNSLGALTFWARPLRAAEHRMWGIGQRT